MKNNTEGGQNPEKIPLWTRVGYNAQRAVGFIYSLPTVMIGVGFIALFSPLLAYHSVKERKTAKNAGGFIQGLHQMSGAESSGLSGDCDSGYAYVRFPARADCLPKANVYEFIEKAGRSGLGVGSVYGSFDTPGTPFASFSASGGAERYIGTEGCLPTAIGLVLKDGKKHRRRGKGKYVEVGVEHAADGTHLVIKSGIRDLADDRVKSVFGLAVELFT